MTIERGRVRWGRALAGFLILEVVMIAAAVGWVAIYSHLLRPGEAFEHYQAYAGRASPVVALVVGLPLFFLVGRRFRSTLGADALPTAVALVAIWLAVDGALLAAAGGDGYNWVMLLGNYPTR